MQDCYIWDEGCGFRCTDATARAMGYEPPAGAATGVPAELFPGEAEQRTGLVAELWAHMDHDANGLVTKRRSK